jgi:hypothetical protein
MCDKNSFATSFHGFPFAVLDGLRSTALASIKIDVELESER